MQLDAQRPRAVAGPEETSRPASLYLRRRPPGGVPHARPRDPVICALDNDGSAAGVLATGASLAERLGAPLTVVHSPYPDIYLAGEPYRLAIERGEEFVERVTDGYRVDERVIEVDDPATLITNVAREGASMVVVGTRGRTGLRAAILGSVSQAVIADAACPVVTVSERALPAVAGLETERAERLAAA
jgi:nucleotide-binding universal stress UspA family protein